MIVTFQKYNAAWTETNVIVTNKDMTERDALAEAFPDATLQLCLFHVLRCLGREVTIDAMSISQLGQQREVWLFIFTEVGLQ